MKENLNEYFLYIENSSIEFDIEKYILSLDEEFKNICELASFLHNLQKGKKLIGRAGIGKITSGYHYFIFWIFFNGKNRATKIISSHDFDVEKISEKLDFEPNVTEFYHGHIITPQLLQSLAKKINKKRILDEKI